MTTRTYSTLFACLYDQTEPVGSLGRGTHYSIMQATQWRDDLGNPTDHPKIHEFAVVWDEDHDERVISVIERLHLAGLMWPVVFIGERKGGLSLLIGVVGDLTGAANDDYKQRVQTICNDVNGDVWNCEFGLFDNSLQDTDNRTYAAGIIDDRENKVLAFLRGVSVLWRLGIQNHAVPSLYSN